MNCFSDFNTAGNQPDLTGNNKETILTNARLVLAGEVVTGSLVIRDRYIVDIASGPSMLPGAENLQQDYLLPGLIELHTDNQEKYFTPRPGVDWPGSMAMAAHDAQLVSAGITTCFDSVALGDLTKDSTRVSKLDSVINAIVDSERSGNNRAEHLLHLRCEVSYPGLLKLFDRYINTDGVKLVSIMDHSPGQRQFLAENEHKYREYYQGKYGFSDAEIEAFITEQKANSARYSEPGRNTIAGVCADRGIITASHDDATLAHVQESVKLGMRIAEFPTTAEAAQASHDQGLKVLMGAPNIIRGGSHSGNIAAWKLVNPGCLDMLSSDYYPLSLLHAGFMVAEMDNNYDLPNAIALVTRNPAETVNLNDRGELATGKQADLVQAKVLPHKKHQPLIQRVWSRGNRVF